MKYVKVTLDLLPGYYFFWNHIRYWIFGLACAHVEKIIENNLIVLLICLSLGTLAVASLFFYRWTCFALDSKGTSVVLSWFRALGIKTDIEHINGNFRIFFLCYCLKEKSKNHILVPILVCKDAYLLAFTCWQSVGTGFNTALGLH